MPKAPPSNPKKRVAATVINKNQQTLSSSRRTGTAPKDTWASTTTAVTGTHKRPSSPSGAEKPVTKKAKAVPLPTTRATRSTQQPSAAATKASSRSTHRPPADINSEDDVAEGPQEPSCSRRVASDDEDAEEYDQAPCDSDEDDEFEHDEDDTELEQLGSKALKRTLMSERPHWAAQATEHKDDGEDEIDYDQDVDYNHDVELTTASELEDKDFDNDANDESIADMAVDDNGDNDEDDGPAKSSSRRARARKAEVPTWIAADLEHSDVEASPTAAMVAPAPNVNAAWPDQAHYQPPSSGSRSLSINAQPPPLSTLSSKLHIDDYFRQTLICLANQFNFLALRDRFVIDQVLVGYVSRLLSTRISNVRCNVKKITLPKVETSYALGGTSAERVENVKSLLKSGDYIYPRTEAGLIRRTKPYHHPMMISSIRETYFSATRGSLAAKHASRFTSSIKTGPQSTELEVPLPMVCTVATAVYASIEDWNSGFLKKSEFNADAYEDVYRGHELFLNDIWKTKPAAYHRLLADLYNEVSNVQGGHSSIIVANNAMAILDLAGMDE